MSEENIPDTVNSDVSALSFEAALAELENVVRQLESGEVALDASVALYARGDALRAHCSARLAAAQARIEQISLSADGAPMGVRPFAAD
jgi:exodeoxyribonuclease VII small subunit